MKNNIMNFKEIAERIILKKQIIESNYFAMSKIVEDSLNSVNNEKDKNHFLNMQRKIDSATNIAITELEILAKRYLDSLESEKVRLLKEKELQLQQKIEYLENNQNNNVSEENPSIIDTAEYPLGNQNTEELEELKDQLDIMNENIYGNVTPEQQLPSLEFEEIKPDDNTKPISIDQINESSDGYTSLIPITDEEQSLINRNAQKNHVVLDDYHQPSSPLPSLGEAEQSIEDIQNSLLDKINELKEENKLAWDANTSLMQRIESGPGANVGLDTINKNAWEQLDIAINGMISKIENSNSLLESTMVNYPSAVEVKNLESMTQAIVGGLEKNIDMLTNEIFQLKQENKQYKEESKKQNEIINNLKHEQMIKDNELNNSYDAWVYSNKKLEDLQNLLNKQTDELQELDGQKNLMINELQDKLVSMNEKMQELLNEKESLLAYQKEMQDYIDRNKEIFEMTYGYEDFDKDVESISLRDLVEKEANRIVDKKVQNVLEGYKKEISDIESRVMLMAQNHQPEQDLISAEIEKIDNNQMILALEAKLESYEKKINNLELELRDFQNNKQQSLYAVSDLNKELGIDFGDLKNNVLSDEVEFKINNLEERINQNIEEKFNSLFENMPQQKPEDDIQYLSEEEMEELVTNSDLYNEIKNEVDSLHNQLNMLKDENLKIKHENDLMVYELDNSLLKQTYNSQKIKDVESLIELNIEELQKLNSEKDELIAELENKLMSKEDDIQSPEDEESQEDKLKQYIEEALNQKLENVYGLQPAKQDEYYKLENGGYGEELIDNSEYVDDENQEDENYLIPVSKSFKSSGYKDSNNKPKHVINNHVYNNDPQAQFNDFKLMVEAFKEALGASKNSEDSEEKHELEIQINQLKNDYQSLLDSFEEEKTKNFDKPYIPEGSNNDDIPVELLESNARLKNFEKLLMQLDSELSNLENTSLDQVLNDN